jgi:nitronate monooxygenase
MAGLTTPLSEILGIDHPLVQAPIGSASNPELAAAVSNAGALGTLAVTWRSLDATRRVIERTQELTDQPFAINLVVDEATTRHPTDEHVAICLDAGAPIISLSFGNPASYSDQIHAGDATLMVTVGSADEARRAEMAGADIVVAQGWEAGGHVQSEVATLPLVPRVADAVDLPVVAAGGIADGRGVAAVLSLGADGAWLGTRFVATEEAAVAPDYSERVVEANETDTFYGELFNRGWPGMAHRALRNSTVEKWEETGRPAPGDRPGEGEQIGTYPNGQSVERYGNDLPVDGMNGETEAMAMYAGQSTGGIETVQPAATVVSDLVEETQDAIERGGRLTR